MRITLLLLSGVLVSALVFVGIRKLPVNQAPIGRSALAKLPVVRANNLTDYRIFKAEAMLKADSTRPDWYNQLAAAFLQRARETGDFGYVAKAEQAVEQALKREPASFDALNLKAQALVVYHRFAEALEIVRQAEHIRADSPDLLGTETDCLVELGRYPEAVKRAQRMMDLRPDAAAYARTAYLRFLHGDPAGAVEAMETAIRSTNPRNPENLAWYRVQLGHYWLNLGKPEKAETQYQAALSTFPNYHVALQAQGHLAQSRGEIPQAIGWYQQALERVPLPESAIALGNLYLKSGQIAEATKQFELAEFIEQSGENGSATYSRAVALDWADRKTRLEDALRSARRERAARADVFTCDVLAWCLYQNHLFSEAQTAIDEALRLGTRDARIHYHAGLIYERLGKAAPARRYLQQALQYDPGFHPLQAEEVRQQLRKGK